MNTLSDLAEKRKVRDTQKKCRIQERVAEIEQSWKSHISSCFSADNKKKKDKEDEEGGEKREGYRRVKWGAGGEGKGKER